jgi:PhnB protein
MPVNFVPEGLRQLIPQMTVSNAAKAIDFYKQAFGAREGSRELMPDGRIMHSHLVVGDCVIFVNDEFPEMGGAKGPDPDTMSPFLLHHYVADADATFNRAVQAGAKPAMPMTDMFWGDRYGQIVDPFGYRWAIATRKENVSPEEAKRRAAAMFGGKK